ncbi:hypothetical protein H5410_002816 [Solanum commersonii]|uniref:Uncharacterized protein n=1 Tax=Solanum commersonii TaxID=4109 RepID=A0A9J6B3B1_SOLCO|nr:hypothetical protein H5410_002816 [Solanum commersonii]
MQRSLSQRRTQCMLSIIGLPIFSNQQLFQLTQDVKGPFKACNGPECKAFSHSELLGDIVLLRGTHTGTLGEVKASRRLTECLGDPRAFFSSSFQLFCFFLLNSVHVLPQIPYT